MQNPDMLLNEFEIQIKPLVVESSQIWGIGYDYPSETLAIQFRKKDLPGSVYYYSNFSPLDLAKFDAVIKGQVEGMSAGQHFALAIKPEVIKFPYVRVS